MAATIFFVGAGVTIIDFCCSNCVENVISMSNKSTSCDMPDMGKDDHSCCSSDNLAKDDASSCSGEHEDKCCEAERISIDIDHRTYKPDLSNSFVSTFVHCYCCCFCHTGNIAESFLELDNNNAEPIPPRDYLSLIRVLII